MTMNKPIIKNENKIALAFVMAIMLLKICTIVAFVCVQTKPHMYMACHTKSIYTLKLYGSRQN